MGQQWFLHSPAEMPWAMAGTSAWAEIWSNNY